MDGNGSTNVRLRPHLGNTNKLIRGDYEMAYVT